MLAPPAAAGRVVAAERGVYIELQAGYAGHIIWSRTNDVATGARTGYAQLFGGKVSRLAIPARAIGGKLDLGPGRRGGAVAVYERCADLGNTGFTSCDIYRYGLASRRVAVNGTKAENAWV